MVVKVLRNSSSNKVAKELKDSRYHQRVVKNKNKSEKRQQTQRRYKGQGK